MGSQTPYLRFPYPVSSDLITEPAVPDIEEGAI